MNKAKFTLKDGGTATVALFQHMQHGWLTIFEQEPGEKDGYFGGDFVRVSEHVTVKLKPVKKDSVLVNAVQAIDAQINKINADAGKAIAALEERRKEFLAITHQPEEA